MTRFLKLTLLALLAAALVMGTYACAKKPVTSARPGEVTTREAGVAGEQVLGPEGRPLTEEELRAREMAASAAAEAFEGDDIYFGFDRYDLTPDDKEILDAKMEFLRANTEFRALIEGHCDERGSNEYNLALGERRASSARDYLIEQGISADRIDTISWGEERPVALDCSQRATYAEREECWQKNRRAHFSLR